MITSELPEAIGMSDRILVFCEGCVSGVVEDPGSVTQEEILDMATPKNANSQLADSVKLKISEDTN